MEVSLINSGKERLFGGVAAILAGLALPMAAFAEDTAGEAARREAVEAVSAMGKQLRALKTFEIHADVAYDDVLDDDVLVQRNEAVTASVRSPDGLAVSIEGADFQRKVTYDGHQVTIYGAALDLYAQFDAPATIRETLEAAAEKHDLEFPLADLFLWGTDDDGLDEVLAATLVGPANIGGRVCDQYVFVQENVSWQIWITRGEQKLPCKLTIIDTAQSSKPQYSAVIDVTPDASFDASTFTFDPPATATKIGVYSAETTAQ